ncbi:MAG: trehalose-phosphatase [Xanthobacteraceae bacterium]
MEIAKTWFTSDLRECAILLDIDGTILDIAPTPREVRVPPGLPETLARLQDLTAGALALVSGRLLNDIDLIFAPLRLAAIGGHGAELRPVPGVEPQRRAASLSSELKRTLAALTELGPGILVEDKGYSLALHYRLAPDLGPVLHAAVIAICEQLPADTVEILPGKAVLEVKPARVSKALAVAELMKQPPFRNRHPIFIGDDVTDEPVFAVIPQFGGLSFSVGRAVAGVDGRFDQPKDVRAWLARIAGDRGDAVG